MTCTTGCGTPTRDTLTLCDKCITTLKYNLHEIGALVEDLDITLTRQARLGRRTGSRSTTTPLPYDQRTSELLTGLRIMLTSWVLRIGKGDPTIHRFLSGPLAAHANYLADHLEAIAVHEDAARIWGDLTTLTIRAARAVDAPPDKLYLGPCGAKTMTGQCEAHLYARPGAPSLTCTACGATWDTADHRQRLLEQLDDRLYTLPEIAMLGTYIGALTDRARTRRLLTVWAHRGHLTPHTHNPDRYRFGDALDRLLASPRATG